MPGTITSDSNYLLAVGDNGEAWYSGSAAETGLARVADTWSPHLGNQREGWGLSVGSNAGFAEQYEGTSAIANISATFTASTATTSTYVLDGSLAHIARVDHYFEFLDVNVVRATVTITRIGAGAITYRRMAAYTVNGDSTLPANSTSIDTVPTGAVATASRRLLPQNISPLIALIDPVTGGTLADSYINVFDVNVDAISTDTTVQFYLFYAIGTPSQTAGDLRNQVSAFGASWMMSVENSGSSTNDGTGVVPDAPSAAVVIGYGDVATPAPASSFTFPLIPDAGPGQGPTCADHGRQVAGVLNSLLRTRQLVLVGLGEWQLLATPNVPVPAFSMAEETCVETFVGPMLPDRAAIVYILDTLGGVTGTF